MLAKCAACVAAFLTLGYASQLIDDLSSSFAHLPGVSAVVPPSVVVAERQEPDGTGRDPATAREEGADRATPEPVPANEPASDAPASEPQPASPDPDALRPVYPSGYVAGGEVIVAVPSSHATLARTLERQVASLSDGACRGFDPWRPVEAVNVIPDGSCARYRTVTGDEPGEEVIAVADNVVRRDDTPPLTPRLVIAEGSANAHAVGDTLFYRAVEGEAGTFIVAAVAEDPESGVTRLSFPALGETASTRHAGSDASVGYEWSSSVSTGVPTMGVVVAMNAAGGASETPLRLVGDADAPAGGFISYRGGVHRDGSVEITLEAGEDATSGIKGDPGVLEQAEARLADGRCKGGWGGWHAADPGGSPGRPACIHFRYRVSDKVGNEAIYGSSVVAKVIDAEGPTVTIIAPLDGATVGETVTLQAEADDTGFGLAAVRFEFSRSGRWHAQWRTIATTTTAPYSATWMSSRLAPGRYYVRALANDRAGNLSASKPVVVNIVEPATSEPTEVPAEHADDPPDVPANEADDIDSMHEAVIESPVPADENPVAPAEEDLGAL
jgi:Bacterial Ig domain